MGPGSVMNAIRRMSPQPASSAAGTKTPSATHAWRCTWWLSAERDSCGVPPRRSLARAAGSGLPVPRHPAGGLRGPDARCQWRSNVGGDQSSCGVVVPPLCPSVTTPPDFRPGLLSTPRAHPIQAPDGSPGVRTRCLTPRSPRPQLTPDLRRLTITTNPIDARLPPTRQHHELNRPPMLRRRPRSCRRPTCGPVSPTLGIRPSVYRSAQCSSWPACIVGVGNTDPQFTIRESLPRAKREGLRASARS